MEKLAVIREDSIEEYSSSQGERWRSQEPGHTLRRKFALLALATVGFLLVYLGLPLPQPYHLGGKEVSDATDDRTTAVSGLNRVQECSIRNIKATNFSFYGDAEPIKLDEFVDRRRRLAKALAQDGADAFAVEPGYTFAYYANTTQQEWEVWEPEERPFLMIISPSDGDGSEATTTFLVPSFEAERARLLGMPFVESETVQWVTYEEHWDPYATLAASGALNSSSATNSKNAPLKLVVDEEMRDFISRGLSTQAEFSILGLGGEVERVRQTKTPAEVAIIRAVNTGTIESIRAMRPCMIPGLTENEVMAVLDNTLRAASMEPFFDIVLFDEDASNPHGGTNGSKVLTNTTMVLIDVGAHLYGYSSDVCRSFFPPFTSVDESTWTDDIRHKLDVWDIVMEAQTKSMDALTAGHSAADVDLAARGVIEAAGYGDAFTHRVGHGIGIKAHESPYLNKGNTGTPLVPGMTFTSEPGIYLVDKFGVRHEDIMLVRERGLPHVLSGIRATDAWNP